MKVIVIGATGTIGSKVTAALETDNEVIKVSKTKADINIDLADKDSISKMYDRVGSFDAVISAAGIAKFADLEDLTDEDIQISLNNKLMGQVNLIREGLRRAGDEASFIVTTGILAKHPMKGSAAISMVNSGLEGFVRAAAMESKEGIRVNAVSPPWIAETLEKLGKDTSKGMPAKEAAKTYKELLNNNKNGEIIEL